MQPHAPQPQTSIGYLFSIKGEGEKTRYFLHITHPKPPGKKWGLGLFQKVFELQVFNGIQNVEIVEFFASYDRYEGYDIR